MSQWTDVSADDLKTLSERAIAISIAYSSIAAQMTERGVKSLKARGVDTVQVLFERIEINAEVNRANLLKSVRSKQYAIGHPDENSGGSAYARDANERKKKAAAKNEKTTIKPVTKKPRKQA